MRITGSQLRKIIREEMSRITISETSWTPGGDRREYDPVGMYADGQYKKIIPYLFEVPLEMQLNPELATFYDPSDQRAVDTLKALSNIPLSINQTHEIAKVLDLSGTLSIPDLLDSLESFNEDNSLLNAIFLLLAALAVIPIVGKIPKLGSKGIRAVIVGVKKAKKLVPAEWGDKANKIINKFDDILVKLGKSPTIKLAPKIERSFNMMKNMKLGTTRALDDDLYVFISANPGGRKVGSGVVSPSMGMGGMRTGSDDAVMKAEKLLAKVKSASSVGRQDTVYLSPWSGAGGWGDWGSNIFLVKIPKGSKITYVDGFDASEVVSAVRKGDMARARDAAEGYWSGWGSSGSKTGGEILTKARVEVLGRADDILDKDILAATTATAALGY